METRKSPTGADLNLTPQSPYEPSDVFDEAHFQYSVHLNPQIGNLRSRVITQEQERGQQDPAEDVCTMLYAHLLLADDVEHFVIICSLQGL